MVNYDGIMSQRDSGRSNESDSQYSNIGLILRRGQASRLWERKGAKLEGKEFIGNWKEIEKLINLRKSDKKRTDTDDCSEILCGFIKYANYAKYANSC